jgi:hypothetical protein
VQRELTSSRMRQIQRFHLLSGVLVPFPLSSPSLQAADEMLHPEAVPGLLHFVRNDEEGVSARGALPETEVDSRPTSSLRAKGEAIYPSTEAPLDCFTSFAMTGRV